MEFTVAKIIGPKNAVKNPLTTEQPTGHCFLFGQPRHIHEREHDRGINIDDHEHCGPTSNRFFSNRRVSGSRTTSDANNPPSCTRGMIDSCSVVMPQKWKPINGLKILSTAKINVLNIIPKKIALNERLLNAALNSRITCFGETDGAGAYDLANSLGSCDKVPAAQSRSPKR